MGFFNSTIAAAASGKTVRVAPLVKFDFLSSSRSVWPGYGSISAGAQTWEGIGSFGSMSEIDAPIGGSAPDMTFTLSGVDAGFVTLSLGDPNEIKGRPVRVYLQFFNEDWATLDDPIAIYLGTMDVMRVKSDGPTKRIIEVTAETLFIGRGMSRWAYWSDRDQNRRFAGDRGLEFISTMTNKTTLWPPPFPSSS
jgi:hypothetical protein